MARTALIVGGGIGGLAAGIALRGAGWTIRIVERAPVLRAEGFALSVAPNAVKALEELGVAAAVAAEAWPVGRVELRDGGGRILKRFDVPTILGASRSLFVLREVLHRVLLEAAGHEHVEAGAPVTSIDATGGRVSVTLDRGRSAESDVLIGADGIGSVVRRHLHPGEGPPRDSGFVGIRGLARDAAHSLGDLTIIGYMGGGVEAGVIRASRSDVYWYVSKRAASAPPANASGHEVLFHAGALLDGFFADLVSATLPADVRIDRLVDRDSIGSWGAGPVTLLGDAAGPVLPHTGQGAAMALEDAVALGLALRGPEIDAGLRRYERVRAARKRPLVTRGRRIAAFTAASHPVAEWGRRTLIRLMPTRAATATFLLARATDPHAALRARR